ncbi:MAG: DUF6512 family protein [Acutalibacteraceae bacterium]|nr:DUF6512 family protein [Acutalibacteraceae bacterium]
MDNRLKRLEIVGVFFVFISGTLLHFLYDWSNGSMLGVLFGSVNESVWEHIKIFAMPYIVWSVIELACSIPYFRQFIVAKVLGLYLLCGLITGFFYLYTMILGRHVLFIDITSVFMWIAIAHIFSYRATTSYKDLRHLFPLCLGLLFLFLAMYFSFTAVPPHIELFKDPVTGMYGIIPENIDVGAYFMSNTQL